ncbi:hypothetical protein [Lyngbya sp. CCY1209]|nr:hypothetical protein [Lyngbya sp. CCY1209]
MAGTVTAIETRSKAGGCDPLVRRYRLCFNYPISPEGADGPM